MHVIKHMQLLFKIIFILVAYVFISSQQTLIVNQHASTVMVTFKDYIASKEPITRPQCCNSCSSTLSIEALLTDLYKLYRSE